MKTNQIIEIEKREESASTIRVIGRRRIELGHHASLAFITKGQYVYVDVDGTLIKIEVVQ